MYTEHPSFITPSYDTVLRRYMSIEKFECLLSDSSLYFSNIQNFTDDNEGNYTTIDKATMKCVTGWDFENNNHEVYGGFYVNSWTKDISINQRFWREYAALDNGVAVESTIGRIIKSLNVNDNRHVYISDVIYIDYNESSTFNKSDGIINVISRCFSKRESFSWEKEIRLLFVDGDKTASKFIPGLLFNVDIKLLIRKICIAPQANSAFKQKVIRLLAKYDIPSYENTNNYSF